MYLVLTAFCIHQNKKWRMRYKSILVRMYVWFSSVQIKSQLSTSFIALFGEKYFNVNFYQTQFSNTPGTNTDTHTCFLSHLIGEFFIVEQKYSNWDLVEQWIITYWLLAGFGNEIDARNEGMAMKWEREARHGEMGNKIKGYRRIFDSWGGCKCTRCRY